MHTVAHSDNVSCTKTITSVQAFLHRLLLRFHEITIQTTVITLCCQDNIHLLSFASYLRHKLTHVHRVHPSGTPTSHIQLHENLLQIYIYLLSTNGFCCFMITLVILAPYVRTCNM